MTRPEHLKAAFRTGQFELDTQSAQAKGLVGWWPFGLSGPKDIHYDYSEQNNDAVVVGTQSIVADYVPRHDGTKVVDLPGTGQYLKTNVITSSSTFTASIWVSFDALSGDHSVLSTREGTVGSTARGFDLWAIDSLYGANGIGARIYSSSGAGTASTGFTATTNKWYHLVVVYDGTKVHFYVDGIEQGTGATGGYGASSSDLWIGRWRHASSSKFLNGQLKDARIYNRALSPSEVRDIYSRPWQIIKPISRLAKKQFIFLTPAPAATLDYPTRRIHSPEQKKAAFRTGQFKLDTASRQAKGLVAWFPLGEASKDFDYSGSHNHGTRTNATSKINHIPVFGGVGVTDFDGTGDRETFGTGLDYAGTTHSCSTWVKLDTTGTTMTVMSMSFESTNRTRLLLQHATGGEFALQRWDGGGGTSLSDRTVTDGTYTDTSHWYHVVYTLDMTSGQFYIYVDGVQDADDASMNDLPVPSSTRVLALGQTNDTNAWTFDFNGRQKDFRLYDRVLSPSEVRDIYSRPWQIVQPLIKTSRLFTQEIVAAPEDRNIRPRKISHTPEKKKAAFRSGQFKLDTASQQAKGLIGWWPLGDRGGVSATDFDYSGRGNHGTRANGASRVVTNHSKFGGIGATNFDGTDDYVSLAQPIKSFPATISVWVRTTVSGSFHYMFGQGSSTIANPIVGLAMDNGSDSARLFVRNAAGTTSHSIGTTAINDGDWHLATGVIEENGNTKIYIDGIFETSENTTVTISAMDTHKIGTLDYLAGDFHFSGDLASLCIYDRALSATEILDIYRNPENIVLPLIKSHQGFIPHHVGIFHKLVKFGNKFLPISWGRAE